MDRKQSVFVAQATEKDSRGIHPPESAALPAGVLKGRGN